MSIQDIYKDGPYWDEWGRKMRETFEEYDRARMQTYLDFCEKQTGIRPQPGDTIEMLGTGDVVVPDNSEAA